MHTLSLSMEQSHNSHRWEKHLQFFVLKSSSISPFMPLPLAKPPPLTLQKNIPPLLQNSLLQKFEGKEKEQATEIIPFYLEMV